MKSKVIHFCWFGRDEKPQIIKRCMESWHKICPDYEIKEWNEDNFDINICTYVKQAYEAKKYAFVSDYARFYILNKFGGVYLDTDVELIKDITPLLVENFTGFESTNSVATGLIMSCAPDDELCKAMLDEYNADSFIKEDGSMNLRTVCERVTDWLVERGLQLNGETQQVAGYAIYAPEYFNPTDMRTGKITITGNTYSIHRYAASWCSKSERIRGKIYKALARVFGVKFAEKVRTIIKKVTVKKLLNLCAHYIKIFGNRVLHGLRRLFGTNLKVMTIEESLDKIIGENLSVVRYGDGELLMMMPQKTDLHSGFQTWNEWMSKRLVEIAKTDDGNILICLPNIFSSYKIYNDAAKRFFRIFCINEKKWYKFFSNKKIYGNAYITRCYQDYKDKSQSPLYFDKMKKIWENKDILIVEGEYSRLGVGNDLFAGTKSIKRILCPHNNAYVVYDEILSAAKEYGKDKLILIALGATATVLAYDLAKLGYRALDVGHVDVEYCWMLMGATSKVPVAGKFVNEAGEEGRALSTCNDLMYTASIIKKIEAKEKIDE